MAKKKTTLAGTILRQLPQGLTLGFSDEISDTISAGIASAILKGDSGRSYGDEFKKQLSLARALSQKDLASDFEERPITSIASQVVGGLPLGFSKVGKATTDWIRSGSALQGVGKGAAVGGGFGAAAGVGASGDSLEERATGGSYGALLGSILGGATAPLSRLGIGSDDVDFRKVTEKTAKGFDNKAQKELARQLSERPDLKEQLARAENVYSASKRSGIPLTLPEIIAQSSNDPLLAQQAVVGSNPMTAGRMNQMYAARSGTPQQAGQIEQRLMQLAQALDPNVGSYDDAARAVIGQADEAQKGITQRLSSQAKPLYDEAYQSTLNADNAILQNPLIQSTLQKARNNPVFAQEIGNLPDNSIQALDAVKRSLDDMAEAANRQGNRNEARLINNARTQLLQAMDEAAPEYAQARQIYSGNPEALQMRQQIGGLADIDPMNTKSVNRALFGGTQQNADLAAQALGEKAPTAAAARIYGAIDELRNDPVNIASRIAPDKRTSDMLRAYAGQQSAPLEETLGVINQAKLGERMRYGSPTQPRQMAEQQLGQAAGDALALGVDVKTGGATALLRKAAQFLGRGSQEQDPQFYKDMADLMLTDQGMDLLRRVSSGQQQAIQELQSVSLPSLMVGKTTNAIGQPLNRALISGMMTPMPQEQNYSPMPQKNTAIQSDLPQGFIIQQNQQELPAGFIIQR